MSKTVLKFILLGIILVLAQVIVFNHICLFNVAVPLVFIYLILRLPITLSLNWLLTISFFLGLIVDIFFRHIRNEHCVVHDTCHVSQTDTQTLRTARGGSDTSGTNNALARNSNVSEISSYNDVALLYNHISD